MSRACPAWALALTLGLGTALAAGLSEYTVKASYLLNIAKLTTWPSSAFNGPKDPLVIGILGRDPFGSTLDDLLKGKAVEGRPLAVKRFEDFTKDKGLLKDCHILFIAESERDHLQEVLGAVKGSPLLTVSEIDRFPLLGGAVQFEREGDRIALSLNPKTARKAGLGLGEKLVQVAHILCEVNAEKAKTLYLEGIQFYLDGKVHEAIKAWNQCLEEDPHNGPALKNLARAKEKLRSIKRIK